MYYPVCDIIRELRRRFPDENEQCWCDSEDCIEEKCLPKLCQLVADKMEDWIDIMGDKACL